MALFKLINGKAKKILRKEFNDERRELQPLIDNNLDTILGIRFIEKWYPIPNGEIDTLGLDDSNVPVIIEYKRKKERSYWNKSRSFLSTMA